MGRADRGVYRRQVPQSSPVTDPRHSMPWWTPVALVAMGCFMALLVAGVWLWEKCRWVKCWTGMCGGTIEHERDKDGVWWVGLRCATCHKFHCPVKSRYQ